MNCGRYALCDSSCADPDVYRQIIEAYRPEHPVVQSYSAYIYWSARLFDNISNQFSKIFKLNGENKLYWGHPDFKRSDRHFLHFVSSLNR